MRKFFTLIAIGHLRVLSVFPWRFVDSVCRDSECDVGTLSVWCLIFPLSPLLSHSHKVPFKNRVCRRSHVLLLLLLFLLACISFRICTCEKRAKNISWTDWDIISDFLRGFLIHSFYACAFEAHFYLYSLVVLLSYFPSLLGFCYLKCTACLFLRVIFLISWYNK